jgi:hypothetical protein
MRRTRSGRARKKEDAFRPRHPHPQRQSNMG